MEYDPSQDIRDFYRARIRVLTKEIETTQRRDPSLHVLHAERRLLREKLATLDESHTAPQGALASYGVW